MSTTTSRPRIIAAFAILALVAIAFVAGLAVGRDTIAPPEPGPPGSRTAEGTRPIATRPGPPLSREPQRPAPSLADSAADPKEGSPPSPAQAVAAPGLLRLEQRIHVHQEMQWDSTVVAVLATGTTVTVMESRHEWTRIEWTDAEGAVAWGWIVLPAPPDVEYEANPPGGGTIAGAVRFTGTPPEMKVPIKRREADFCKTKDLRHNAVRVRGGMLADVLVRIENGAFKKKFAPPDARVVLEQVDCMYAPRIQGAVTGQEIAIINKDGTLHNVHPTKGAETWFNQAQPKGSEPLIKPLEPAGIFKFTCDAHPWMRAFVVVTDHPFFAVSDEDGSFVIGGVPPGTYALEAWHARYGLKVNAGVEVVDGARTEVRFTYDAADTEPDENKDELKGLW